MSWAAQAMLVARMVGTLLLTLAPSLANSDDSIAVEFQIHPELDIERCARLPDTSEVPEEADFPKLLTRGWASLQSHTFDQARKFWPCMQQVRVTFPSRKLYREFAHAMSACPQYPFYSGADYRLQEQIFERTVDHGDAEVLRLLLAKDDRDCESELNAPLYAILRRNPGAFVSAFARLTPAQQRVAASVQYDFNLELRDQQFSANTISSLPEELRSDAVRFNELLAASAK